MGRLIALAVISARVIQVILGFLATGFSIALSQPYDTELGITVSAAYCSGGIAFCGLLALLAMSQKPNVHWAMVLMLDLLGIACCAGAAGILTYATRDDLAWYFNYSFSPALLYPPLVMDYTCMAILLVLSVRSFLFWLRNFRAQSRPEAQAKELPPESWYDREGHDVPQIPRYQVVPPAPPRVSQDRYLDVKSISSPRPLSTVASEAYWSDISGGATLTHAPSVRSSETKRPPSYASPVPSRAPTTIHRKPLT